MKQQNVLCAFLIRSWFCLARGDASAFIFSDLILPCILPFNENLSREIISLWIDFFIHIRSTCFWRLSIWYININHLIVVNYQFAYWLHKFQILLGILNIDKLNDKLYKHKITLFFRDNSYPAILVFYFCCTSLNPWEIV